MFVVAPGLLGRQLPGLTGDILGGLLYAVLLYLVCAFIAPRARPVLLAAIAAGIGLVVELFQITGIPAELGAVWPPARLVLGTTFVPLDLVIAVAGAACAPVTDLLTRRREAKRHSPDT